MAITYKGAIDGGATRDTIGKWSVIRTLVFLFDNYEKSDAVLAQPQIPMHGSAHPTLSFLSCSGVQIDSNKGVERGKYNVQCTYSNNSITYSSSVEPWNQPLAGWFMGPVDQVVPFEFGYQQGDAYGKPTQRVCSSAGTPLGATTNDPNLVIRFSYNAKAWKDSWIADFYNTTNATTTTVAGIPVPAWTGLLKSLSGEELLTYNDNGTVKWRYYKISVEVELCKKSFKRQIVDQSEWFKNNNKTERIYTNGDGLYGSYSDMQVSLNMLAQTYPAIWKDRQPQPVGEPQLLDGKGGILYNTGAPSTGQVPTYFTSYDKFPREWSTLGIPKSRGGSSTYVSGL